MAALENPYAARLDEFSSFAFNEPHLFSKQGEWKSFFSSRLGVPPSKIIFEIGCSSALLLNEVAQKNPKVGFVGIDWKFKAIYRAAKKACEHDLRNVAFLRGRAQGAHKIFAAAEVDEIWIFFPDPWAKTSQTKNRLLQAPYLLELKDILKVGGKLHFKTDHPGYFQWVLSIFGRSAPDLPAEYDAPDLAGRSKRARQVRVRRVETRGLPAMHPGVVSSFEVKTVITDYAKHGGESELFSGHKTFFEGIFSGERLPIYYIEFVRTK